tara:strand:+ start:775 stop:942 length:168 start_codon:yes stop_codon:yes gene_type:complete
MITLNKSDFRTVDIWYKVLEDFKVLDDTPEDKVDSIQSVSITKTPTSFFASLKII